MAKQARGEETIERVLAAALALAAVRGPVHVTIEQLAARSGVSMGSIYHHFGARDGVLFVLYRRCLEAMLAAIVAEVLPCRGAREGVHRLVAAYVGWVRAHPDEARVIYGLPEVDLDPTHRAELATLGARVVAPLAAWLGPHIEAGSIRALSPAVLEVALIGPAAEACRRILCGHPGLSYAEAEEVLPEVVWQGVRGG